MKNKTAYRAGTRQAAYTRDARGVRPQYTPQPASPSIPQSLVRLYADEHDEFADPLEWEVCEPETADTGDTDGSEPDDDDDGEADAPRQLIPYLERNDSERARIERTPATRGRVFDSCAAHGVPDALVSKAAQAVIMGRNLRRRRDAQARDTILTLGRWFDGLPRQHGVRPYVVARTFGYPCDGFATPPHELTRAQVRRLEGYARLWRTFGATLETADAPARLFHEIVSIRDPRRRDYWIDQWVRGDRGRDAQGRTIYDRIREERAAQAEQRAAACAAKGAGTKNVSTNRVNGSIGGDVFALSPEWAAVLPALIEGAARAGLTPAQAVQRALEPAQTVPASGDDAQKRSRANFFVYVNRAEQVDAETPPVSVRAPHSGEHAPAHAVVTHSPAPNAEEMRRAEQARQTAIEAELAKLPPEERDRAMEEARAIVGHSSSLLGDVRHVVRCRLREAQQRAGRDAPPGGYSTCEPATAGGRRAFG